MREASQRVFSIEVRGFDPARFTARNASAARYKAYRAWRDAGYGRGWGGTVTFGDFLKKIVRTLHLGVAP